MKLTKTTREARQLLFVVFVTARFVVSFVEEGEREHDNVKKKRVHIRWMSEWEGLGAVRKRGRQSLTLLLS